MTVKVGEKVSGAHGTGAWVRGDDLDTDRIIPAEFLKCVSFNGLGEYLFYHDRRDAKGEQRDHPLNDPRFKDASIMVSGRNFGCGSSREHAPQSLCRAGFRAVIAESFAEIFFSNCTILGLICVTIERAFLERLGALIEAQPDVEISVDLECGEVRCGELVVPASMPVTARDALMGGYWDPLSDLLKQREAVVKISRTLPYMEW